jgi:hypothetical protein
MEFPFFLTKLYPKIYLIPSGWVNLKCIVLDNCLMQKWSFKDKAKFCVGNGIIKTVNNFHVIHSQNVNKLKQHLDLYSYFTTWLPNLSTRIP